MPDGLSLKYDQSKPEQEDLRMRSTRTFWDPEYMPVREYMIRMNQNYGTGTPQIVPRFKRWVAENYPGTRVALMEYWWGALDHITGAIAQADLLGIFGREGVDVAAIWTRRNQDQPGAFAFRVFQDYDGRGNGFGDTSVQATTEDPDRLSVFGAQRSDGALTILVLNKTRSALGTTLRLRGLPAQGAAEVWEYSHSDLTRIVRREDAVVSAGGISAGFPKLSMTMLVVKPVEEYYSVPKPVIAAVTNTASYAPALCPGQMVTV